MDDTIACELMETKGVELEDFRNEVLTKLEDMRQDYNLMFRQMLALISGAPSQTMTTARSVPGAKNKGGDDGERTF